MGLATSGVVRVAKKERKLRSGFFWNKATCEDGMITNLSSMKMPRMHLHSQEFVLIIGRYRHARWDCNSILFIFSSALCQKAQHYWSHHLQKMSSICRILSRVIIQGRSQTLKINFEKLFSLKVFKNTYYNYYPFSVLSWQNLVCAPSFFILDVWVFSLF